MRLSPSAAGILGLVICNPGAAAEAPVVPPPMASCSVLTEDAARLKCYDTVAGRTPTQKVDSAAPVAAEPAQEGRGENGAMAAAWEAATPVPAEEPPSPLAERWQLVAQTDRGPFVITPYRPTYILPLSYVGRRNTEPFQATFGADEPYDSIEAKFQLSFMTKLWPELLDPRGDLWFAYTQQSFWQAYNGDASAPFRETNYEPELIYSWKTNVKAFGLNSRLLNVSLDHQSNGRDDPVSRSWNRVVASALFDQGDDFALGLKGWWRLPEDAEDDDNPDIEDYVGRAELWTFWTAGRNHYAVMLRNNLDFGDPRGALQLDWSIPLGHSPVRGYVQYFYGYGDGLIDYDFIANRLSLGFLLTDWM